MNGCHLFMMVNAASVQTVVRISVKPSHVGSLHSASMGAPTGASASDITPDPAASTANISVVTGSARLAVNSGRPSHRIWPM